MRSTLNGWRDLLSLAVPKTNQGGVEMKRLVMALMLLSTAVFAGCVTVQPPVHLDQSYWSHKPASLGVVIVKMPKPGTLKMGNQGLLDMGISGMMADSLHQASQQSQRG
jgi:hypothetical protein